MVRAAESSGPCVEMLGGQCRVEPPPKTGWHGRDSVHDHKGVTFDADQLGSDQGGQGSGQPDILPLASRSNQTE